MHVKRFSFSRTVSEIADIYTIIDIGQESTRKEIVVVFVVCE